MQQRSIYILQLLTTGMEKVSRGNKREFYNSFLPKNYSFQEIFGTFGRATGLVAYVSLCLLLFAAVIGIMAVSFSTNEVDANPLTGQIDLFAGLSRAYPPTLWFMNAIHDQSILYLGLLVGSHALAFGLFIFLIQGLVQKTNQKGVRSNIRKNNKALKYQSKPVVQALIYKEFKKFFNSIIYFCTPL